MTARPQHRCFWARNSDSQTVTFLYYIISFAVSQVVSMRRKPGAMLSSHSLAFHPRIMSNAKWSNLGVIVNILSLFVCVLLLISVIAITVQPLDVVLNILAVFFLLSLDNILVPKVHLHICRNNLRACLERSINDPSLPVVVRSRGFHSPFLLFAVTIAPCCSLFFGIWFPVAKFCPGCLWFVTPHDWIKPQLPSPSARLLQR